MALDVYVGSLSRYYAEEWENVAQRGAREQGIKYTRITPGGVQKPPRPNEVAPAIAAWREALTRGLGPHLPEPLGWDESMVAPYFTDRPGYPGYSGLLLWAAYADATELAPPSRLPEEGWYADEQYLRAIEKESGTRFRTILQPNTWLPSGFRFTFQGPSPVNEPTWIGSSITLVEQLELLNRETFKATEETLQSYLCEEIDAANEVEHAAKFALAAFLHLARKAVAHRLPMVISC